MKVLIVDDDVVARMVLMDLIDRAGAGAAGLEVIEAEDGEQAWDLLAGGERPALLFCDLRMPRLSGMELLARVKADARFTSMRFVLVSAANDAATMQQALGLGADGYVVKPFDADKLSAHLDRLPADDELPLAVARRLGIGPERLLAYLGGLQRQLEEATPEVGRLLLGGDIEAARARLGRLADGCRMLGIASAGVALDGQARQPAPDTAVRALDSALAAVLCRIGTLRGPAGGPA